MADLNTSPDVTLGQALDEIVDTIRSDKFFADIALPIEYAQKKLSEGTTPARQEASSILQDRCRQISKLPNVFQSEKKAMETIIKLLDETAEPVTLSTTLPGLKTTRHPDAPIPERKSLAEGTSVTVTQDFLYLIRECNAIDLVMTNAAMDKALGQSGRVCKVDQVKSVVEVEDIGVVPIRSLNGFDNWRPPVQGPGEESKKSTSMATPAVFKSEATTTAPILGPPPPLPSKPCCECKESGYAAPIPGPPPPLPSKESGYTAPIPGPAPSSNAKNQGVSQVKGVEEDSSEEESEFVLKPNSYDSPDEMIRFLLRDEPEK